MRRVAPFVLVTLIRVEYYIVLDRHRQMVGFALPCRMVGKTETVSTNTRCELALASGIFLELV